MGGFLYPVDDLGREGGQGLGGVDHPHSGLVVRRLQGLKLAVHQAGLEIMSASALGDAGTGLFPAEFKVLGLS